MSTPGDKSTLAKRMESFGLLFAQSEQSFLVTFVLVSLLGITVWSWRYSSRVEQIIDIDQRSPASAAFQIDLNTATWTEICTLPGIGDQLARDIVAHRQQIGSFPSNEAVQSVSGIGPLTYQRIAPFLIAISSDAGATTAVAPVTVHPVATSPGASKR